MGLSLLYCKLYKVGIHYEDGSLIIILQAMQTVGIHYDDGFLIIILQVMQTITPICS